MTIHTFFFADDSLILMSDDMSNATALRNALEMYRAISRQLLSEANSSIFFQPEHQCSSCGGGLSTPEYSGGILDR
jgi:hypothetical protein